MRISKETYNKLINNSISVKESKYKAKKTTINGIKFDSKKEATRYTQLLQMEQLGIIKDLKLQVKYELQPKFIINNKTIRSINYVADFTYTIVDTKEEIIEDTKGIRTEVYKIKKKMFMYKYGKEIKEV